MIPFFQRSIRSKFFLAMLSVIVITCVATSILFFVQYTSKVHQQEVTEELVEKRDILNEITESYQSMVFGIRGYLAFSNENELQEAEQDRVVLESLLADAKQMGWRADQYQMLESLDEFVNAYWEERFPPVQELLVNEDYEAIHEAGINSTTNEVSQLINQLQQIQTQAQSDLNDMNSQFLNRVELISYLMFGLLVLVVSILSVAFRILSRGIGRPLIELSEASEALATGSYEQLPSSQRKDEIGKLTRSFRHMAEQISEREENLSAQNEELVAQQEMLESYVNDLRNKDLALNESSMVARLDKGGWIESSNGNLADVSMFRERELEGRHF